MAASARPLMAGIAMLLVVAGCAAQAVPATPSPELETPSPSVAGPAQLTVTNIDKPLSPGTYRVAGPFEAAFTLAIPTEWTLKGLERGDVELVNSATGQTGAAWLVVDLVENVFADPCHATGPSDPPVARTVDGVVAALTRMTGYEAGTVTDVTVGGHAGKALEITNSIDTETDDCAGGPMLPMWTFTGGGSAQTNGGATEQLWVVDVDGTPVIIDGETFPNTPSHAKDEIRDIVSSLAFE